MGRWVWLAWWCRWWARWTRREIRSSRIGWGVPGGSRSCPWRPSSPLFTPVAGGGPGGPAARGEAGDFLGWVRVGGKPPRRHWRGDDDAAGVRPGMPVPNRVTGKSPPGPQYATATVVHGETVLRTFYDFHLQAGAGPLVNPFPLARAGPAHAHHNPMEPFAGQRAGLFRPRPAQRVPRQIPDGKFA